MTEWACVFLLSGPFANAVSVIGVVASAPRDHARLVIGDLIGLALETGLVDAVLADGAILHCHVPAPQGHCVPLLHLDALVDLHLQLIRDCLSENKLFKHKKERKVKRVGYIKMENWPMRGLTNH